MGKQGINDFFEILKSEQEKNTKDEPFCIGVIQNVKPLVIKLGDLPLYEKDLMVNAYLREWTENVTGSTTSGSCSVGSAHTHGLSYINHPSKLKAGRRVALYGIEYDDYRGDYQKYVVLEVLDI